MAAPDLSATEPRRRQQGIVLAVLLAVAAVGWIAFAIDASGGPMGMGGMAAVDGDAATDGTAGVEGMAGMGSAPAGTSARPTSSPPRCRG